MNKLHGQKEPKNREKPERPPERTASQSDLGRHLRHSTPQFWLHSDVFGHETSPEHKRTRHCSEQATRRTQFAKNVTNPDKSRSDRPVPARNVLRCTKRLLFLSYDRAPRRIAIGQVITLSTDTQHNYAPYLPDAVIKHTLSRDCCPCLWPCQRHRATNEHSGAASPR